MICGRVRVMSDRWEGEVMSGIWEGEVMIYVGGVVCRRVR